MSAYLSLFHASNLQERGEFFLLEIQHRSIIDNIVIFSADILQFCLIIMRVILREQGKFNNFSCLRCCIVLFISLRENFAQFLQMGPYIA